jgi:Nickel responsive protein SCO4226-like
METFVILRRHAWSTPADLAVSADLSTRVGNDMPNDVRWIRSYVVRETDGSLATVCIYQGTGEQAIRSHAKRAGMRADEVLPVIDTVIVRPDPVAAKHAA